MKKVFLFFALLIMISAMYGQTNPIVLDSKFFSMFQDFLDNADGVKINSEDGRKILHQQITEKSILITTKRTGTIWSEEVFNIEWLINQDNSYLLLNIDDENKSLFRFEMGFKFDYSYYYYAGNESKGELRKTNARIRFYILRKDLSKFRQFLLDNNINFKVM